MSLAFRKERDASALPKQGEVILCLVAKETTKNTKAGTKFAKVNLWNSVQSALSVCCSSLRALWLNKKENHVEHKERTKFAKVSCI